jgi:hypothetical protein
MRLFFIGLVLLLLLTGCGKGVSVKGKVLFDDGTPLTKGTVIFDNQKEAFQGTIKEDGTFLLGVVKDNERIPSGKYLVYLTDTFELKEEAGGRWLNPLVDPRFTVSSTSGISVEVERGMSEITIEVQKPDPQTIEYFRKQKIQ